MQTIKEKIEALSNFQFKLQQIGVEAEELNINDEGINQTIRNVALQLKNFIDTKEYLKKIK